jgi:mono/diheme cytochrome c family protein
MLKSLLKSCFLLSAAILFVIAAGYSSAPTLAAGHMPQASPAPPASTNPVRSTVVSQDKAKKMYAVDCAVCHGETGDGKTDLAKDMSLTMPDWTDPKTLGNKSDQELYDIIRKGKDKMPAEDAGRAKDADVWGLVTYIRVLSKNHTAPPVPAEPVASPEPAAPAAPAAPPAPTN